MADAGEECNGHGGAKTPSSLHETEPTKQLPTPVMSPATPTDPFPALEITASTPAPNLEAEDCDSIDHDGLVEKANEEDGSSSDVSSNLSDQSSTSIEMHEDIPGPSKPPSDRPQVLTKPRTPSGSSKKDVDTVRKLSASEMKALAASPDSLPHAVLPESSRSQYKPNGKEYPLSAGAVEVTSRPSMAEMMQSGSQSASIPIHTEHETGRLRARASYSHSGTPHAVAVDRSSWAAETRTSAAFEYARPPVSSRTLSTPPINRRSYTGGTGTPTVSTAPHAARRNSFNPLARPLPLNLGSGSNHIHAQSATPFGSSATQGATAPPPERVKASPLTPIPPTLPLPPPSLPTLLQLELAGQRPSPLYIYHPQSADTPYESSAVKFERLLNSLLLPPYLEQLLMFGALACLDAWLYTFTILPMRFCIATGVLVRWWAYLIWKEARWVTGFVWVGIWRLWRRGRRGRSADRRNRADSSQNTSEAERSQSRTRENGASAAGSTSNSPLLNGASDPVFPNIGSSLRTNGNGHGLPHLSKHATARMSRHRRTKSMPSNLTSFHKADILQGLVIIFSSIALMNFDASRMYHFVRAQSAMKLYVIYNVLEVGDRLLGALGQDILECLFSSETLSRNSSGRSKLLLPFGMFILSLIYNVVHATCLFYQVVTLNVAVNSYSNALLTLLVSNQFVEIKGTVFKKFEKENLFQLTLSDVVERFQLWVSLLIIGMRNVVEVGGLSVPGAGSEMDGPVPLHTSNVLPVSFTALPSWLKSGEVLSPFLIVIGSEMLVDWIKHAYINKFNNVKPKIYGRMLDIMCKDYYTDAFVTPSLTRRLGLPVLPLSCLFIRASVQIYHMFLSTHLPQPNPTSTTELSVESSAPSSPVMTAALERLDALIRNALGRATYGYASSADPLTSKPWWAVWSWNGDDAIALVTMVIFFFLAWVVLLIFKLLLGMLLLQYARKRYANMMAKEQAALKGEKDRMNYVQPGKRRGGWGHVEVDDDKRRWVYDDDTRGLEKMRDRELKGDLEAEGKVKTDDKFPGTVRYEMVAKRIW